MVWKIVRGVLFVLGLGLTALIASNCTMLTLNYASLETANKPVPTPVIEAASLQDWEASRPALFEAFSTHVYGPWPDGWTVSFGETRIVDDQYQGGLGVLEETPVTIGTGNAARTFHLVTAYPKTRPASGAPVILAQTFSSNCGVFLGSAVTGPGGAPCNSGEVPGVFKFIFGQYIAKAPTDQYLARGYAYASFYASEFVPDRNTLAQNTIQSLDVEGATLPTSALSAWAYAFSAALTYLESDDRIDPDKTALFGHSRHGKAVLVAAAWDERVDAAFAHQSGFGGASLNRSKTGEGLERVAKNYPHWFDPTYGSYADREDEIPVDQHQFLALIAPRPVLLGNARRDVWSDPNSSYRAAQAADAVYELYGVEGFDQSGLKDFNPDAELAFHMRGGAHGVQQEDVDAMLDFFDAHFADDDLPDTYTACAERATAEC
ncbi:MAG: alpha/beta hydrolase [Pseudomonadota bacterium]